MAILQETSADLATALDDFATVLTTPTDADGNQYWQDADSGVTNSGASNAPEDNGRVFSNTNTGTFLFLFITHGEIEAVDDNGDNLVGIRAIHSTDWDTNAHRPAGYTTAIQRDPWGVYNVTHRSESFSRVYYGKNLGDDNQSTDRYQKCSEESGMGLFTTTNNMSNRTAARTNSATYYASARGDGFQAAIWDTSDGNNGIASAFSFEYVDSPFGSVESSPVALTYRDTVKDSSTQSNAISAYGFRSWGAAQSNEKGTVGCIRGPVAPGEWGVLNPDADDDTFFFRRPVVFQTVNQTYRPNNPYGYKYPEHNGPVAFFQDTIPNDPGMGAAHGDVVTHDGTDYRMMVQSGASRNYAIGLGLRYE